MEKFFGKIQNSDLQQSPKFKQFAQPKFGDTALQNSDKQFFIKFDFYRQIKSTKTNYKGWFQKILSEIENIR